MENTKKLEISAVFKIPKGKLDEFNLLAAESIRLSKEKDTGTLKYDFYISSDETEGEMREEYESSEAVLEHMANLGEHQQEMFSDFPLDHVNVYGNPSSELLEAAKDFDVRVYSFSQGLEKAIVV
ncbi:MAG: antibiotic biosynthesis monooxygenase [Candidatus Lokiarchaeota archaeon]|nr:antibiotic biosynthesis monooxygenase [Candidatus Lokiarchaeota archaeon]